MIIFFKFTSILLKNHKIPLVTIHLLKGKKFKKIVLNNSAKNDEAVNTPFISMPWSNK